jgi:hypothetical protein
MQKVGVAFKGKSGILMFFKVQSPRLFMQRFLRGYLRPCLGNSLESGPAVGPSIMTTFQLIEIPLQSSL